MKLESLVIANQQCRGEYVLGVLYTPPVTPRELVAPEVAGLTRKEGCSEGVISVGVKS